VAAHTDYTVKRLHNQSKYFVQTRHEHHHQVQKCRHQHVQADVVEVDCIDVGCTGPAIDVVVLVSLELVAVLVATGLWLVHIPMECIVRSIRLVVLPR
jgi:hypothetical protein